MFRTYNKPWGRSIARVIVLFWASLWMLAGPLESLSPWLWPEPSATPSQGDLNLLWGNVITGMLPGLIFLFTAFIAWRWETVGGTLLLLEALSMLAVLGPTSVPEWFALLKHFASTFEGFLMLTMPPLIAGFLFLADRLMEQPPRYKHHAHR